MIHIVYTIKSNDAACTVVAYVCVGSGGGPLGALESHQGGRGGAESTGTY